MEDFNQDDETQENELDEIGNLPASVPFEELDPSEQEELAQVKESLGTSPNFKKPRGRPPKEKGRSKQQPPQKANEKNQTQNYEKEEKKENEEIIKEIKRILQELTKSTDVKKNVKLIADLFRRFEQLNKDKTLNLMINLNSVLQSKTFFDFTLSDGIELWEWTETFKHKDILITKFPNKYNSILPDDFSLPDFLVENPNYFISLLYHFVQLENSNVISFDILRQFYPSSLVKPNNLIKYFIDKWYTAIFVSSQTTRNINIINSIFTCELDGYPIFPEFAFRAVYELPPFKSFMLLQAIQKLFLRYIGRYPYTLTAQRFMRYLSFFPSLSENLKIRGINSTIKLNFNNFEIHKWNKIINTLAECFDNISTQEVSETISYVLSNQTKRQTNAQPKPKQKSLIRSCLKQILTDILLDFQKDGLKIIELLESSFNMGLINNIKKLYENHRLKKPQ